MTGLTPRRPAGQRGMGDARFGALAFLRRRRVVHLINPLWNATGGSELRTVSLFEALEKEVDVRLWTEYTPDATLAARYPVRRVAPRRGVFPKTGTFVFVGVYRHPRRWIRLTCPRRVIVIYNTPDPDLLEGMLDLLERKTCRKAELVYASDALRRSTGRPGVVHASPIDIGTFVPGPRQVAPDGSGELVVGRLSRDSLEKHHHLDYLFYERLAASGAGVRIMGGTCLAAGPTAASLAAPTRIELLPEGAEESRSFLHGLDVFFYRTAEHWDEPFGRVIVEAMACGLPVVCCNRGGFTEVVEHGVNGFLFDRDEEAFEIIQRLRNDPALRQAVGRAARETVERLYAPHQQRALLEYYVR